MTDRDCPPWIVHGSFAETRPTPSRASPSGIIVRMDDGPSDVRSVFFDEPLWRVLVRLVSP